jgi:hypothetical protein
MHFFYSIDRMSWLLRGRELIFGAYDHLPHIFTLGSLVVGSMTGIVPILILGLVSSLVGFLILITQSIFKKYLGENVSILKYLSSDIPCYRSSSTSTEILISSWATMASFIIIYIFLNAVTVFNLPPVPGAKDELLANRYSYMVSVMVSLVIIGLIFIASRMQLGCETYVMGTTSILLGLGLAIAMWNLVSVGGKDIRMGDIFQVRNNMTPIAAEGVINPVMCVAPQ